MEQYSIEYFRWCGRWLQALSVVIHSAVTSLSIYGNVRCGCCLYEIKTSEYGVHREIAFINRLYLQ